MKKEIVIGPILLLVGWTVLYYAGVVNQVLVPGPLSVGKALIVGFWQGRLLNDLGATLGRFSVSFSLAAVTGVLLGVLLGYFRGIYNAVEVVVDFFRSIPATALLPLFMIFFGTGDLGKVVLVFFSCSLIILINTAYGVRNASRLRIMMAQSLKATKAQILFRVILPDSLSHICAGFRVGISFALIVVVVTEMFVGTATGIGRRIIDAQLTYHIPDMYASIIVVGAAGYLLNKGFVVLERNMVHWSGR